TGLVALFWNCPVAVRDFAPAYARNLGAPCGGEQQEANVLSPRGREGLGGMPDRTQFIIGEHAVALALLWLAPRHPAHDGALEVLVARSMPVHDSTQQRQHPIGHCGTALVLNLVEQPADVAAPDLADRQRTQRGIHKPLEYLPTPDCRAKLVALADEVILGD